MIKSREQAIEAAKAMVSSKFDISSQAMGMMRGGSGNIYEAKASKDVKNNLVEFSGKYSGMDSETKSISIVLEKETVSLIPIKETVYSRSIVGAKIPRGEMLYVIAVRAENHPVYVPVVIIRDEEKQNFMMVKSIFGRANAIKTFYKLESAKQEAILSQLGTNHYNRFESDEDIVFRLDRSWYSNMHSQKKHIPLIHREPLRACLRTRKYQNIKSTRDSSIFSELPLVARRESLLRPDLLKRN